MIDHSNPDNVTRFHPRRDGGRPTSGRRGDDARIVAFPTAAPPSDPPAGPAVDEWAPQAVPSGDDWREPDAVDGSEWFAEPEPEAEREPADPVEPEVPVASVEPVAPEVPVEPEERWADPVRISFAGATGGIGRPEASDPAVAAPTVPGVAALDAVVNDAEDQLLRVLRRGDRSRAEARAVLEGVAELGEGHIEDILDHVTELGYLDDERLAEQLVDRLSNRKGQGAHAVRRGLQARGLEPQTIEVALASLDDDVEDERAFDLARGRAARLGGVDPETALRRLVGFLQRRGYDGALSMRAAKAALGAPGSRRRPVGARDQGRTGAVYFGNDD